ncbi:PREDICTED: malectin-A-like [Amphimedon queenslandica]|uniref:Malectin domain-containing protein n=1 Tax=Amphimedon queenslandica TaxID=400682 RepID=A0A1X7T5K5_AMPQE|nr:PREDICTED: malectin-A-like [Amphimedon queenslandica]|eukprot:XP_003391082.1 PREDICTED: malectin-A-like [Amphimedon queenslandica]
MASVKSPLLLLLTTFSLLYTLVSSYEVIYAVNCGGGRHTDTNGIRYRRDESDAGVASDFGKGLTIARVPPEDQILYQTERYHYRDFSYDVSIKTEGEHFVVLKFAEVYFQRPNEKVFDVVLNNHFTVASNLDIFARVGRAVAFDMIIPFTVHDGQITVNEETSDFDGTLVVEFSKGLRDNPKINAIVVAKGNPGEFPPLPPLEQVNKNSQQQAQPETDGEWGDTSSKGQKFKRPSGPRAIDPYSSDESWFWPITIAIAVFLPVMFCLCGLS